MMVRLPPPLVANALPTLGLPLLPDCAIAVTVVGVSPFASLSRTLPVVAAPPSVAVSVSFTASGDWLALPTVITKVAVSVSLPSESVIV